MCDFPISVVCHRKIRAHLYGNCKVTDVYAFLIYPPYVGIVKIYQSEIERIPEWHIEQIGCNQGEMERKSGVYIVPTSNAYQIATESQGICFTLELSFVWCNKQAIAVFSDGNSVWGSV